MKKQTQIRIVMINLVNLSIKNKIKNINNLKPDRELSFREHSLYSRMKMIGAW